MRDEPDDGKANHGYERRNAVIEIVQGDLIAPDAEALVNAVNTVGVMGKGIALQFRREYPEMFAAYEVACHTHQV